MARSETKDDDFDRLVGELHRLDDTELLLAWKVPLAETGGFPLYAVKC